MKIPIITVVPQPGATFPYSEFNGFKIVPNVVTFPFELDILFFDIVVIIIYDLKVSCFTFFRLYFSCSSKGSIKLTEFLPNPEFKENIVILIIKKEMNIIVKKDIYSIF